MKLFLSWIQKSINQNKTCFCIIKISATKQLEVSNDINQAEQP